VLPCSLCVGCMTLGRGASIVLVSIHLFVTYALSIVISTHESSKKGVFLNTVTHYLTHLIPVQNCFNRKNIITKQANNVRNLPRLDT